MEDILLLTAVMLADNEEVAAQVRRTYKWFVVDEFQDVNPLQATLLDLWLGGREEICVVGDPRQTIYSFAGASPDVLREFTRKYEGAQRVELVRNYRSTPQIVRAANRVIGGTAGVELVAQCESGPKVSYVGHADEPAEARAVAREIAALHASGIGYRDMAVLFRINAQSEAFEEALGAALIPFTLRGVEGFFHRAEVRQAVTLLRGAARADEGSDGGLLGDVRAVLASMGYTDEPPTGTGQVRDRWESLHAIVSMAAELPADAGLGEMVADLDRRAEHAHAPVADGVTLATLHAAKGLEWAAVFCVGMHEGMMPSVHAQTPAAVEEERRLFYVGLTRAKRHLWVSWAASRNPGGRGNRGPTRFLDGLIDAPAPRRARKRSTPVPVGDFDAALFERLREWRAAESSRQSVPAFVVFNDATLQAIAATLPADERALLTLPGIGPAKVEKYGSAVLGIVGEAGQ
jgi:DNA helicase-2/ATP-dependent DNA helicase PcrA